MPISPSSRISADSSSSLSPSRLTRSWLDQVTWRKEVSKELKSALNESDFSALASGLRASWKLRKKQRKTLEQIVDLLRSLPLASADSRASLSSLLTRLSTSREPSTFGTELKELLFSNESPDLHHEPESLAGLYLLRLFPDCFDDETLVELFRQLALKELLDEPQPAEFRDLNQLQALVELPILTGLVLQDLKGAGKLVRQGRKAARIWLSKELDSQGRPHARWIPVLPEVIMLLARVTLLAQLSGEGLWDEQDQERLRELVSAGLAIASPGRLAFSDRDHAIEILGKGVRGLHVLSRKEAPASLLKEWAGQAAGTGNGPGKKRRTWSLPDESWQSDESGWAVMRSDWNSPSSCCRVLHESPTPLIDIVLRDQPVISGPWSAGWRIDGRSLPLLNRWKCECWFSDEDMDYIELSQKLSDEELETHPAREFWKGVHLVRQLMFAKQDQCLVLADTICCSHPCELEYQSELAVDSTLEWSVDSMTREAALTRPGLRVRLLPIGLPQQRVTPSSGTMNYDSGSLSLTQRASSRGMVVPLVFEWSPARKRLPVDWNLLTVAEDGRKVGSDESSGYRFRIGTEQWLLYRELIRARMGRSLLGMHTLNETVFARFLKDGTFQELLLVEGTRPA